MTYFEQVGTERIKDDAVTAAKADLTEIVTIGDAQTITQAKTFERAVDTDASIETQVTGDTTPRLVTAADGKHSWGPGNAAADLFLERGFAGGLRVTGNQFQLFDNGGFAFQGIIVRGTLSSQNALNLQAVGDLNPRLVIGVDGSFDWGNGTAASDTNLYRSAVGELKTDTDFEVGGNLRIEGDSALGNAITDLIGFYGAAAVAQAAAIAAPAVQTGAYVQADVQSIADSVNDIISALAGIGITA